MNNCILQQDDEGSVEVMQITADDSISISGSGDSKTDIIASGHGHLVQQILETQKELANEDAPKVEIVRSYTILNTCNCGQSLLQNLNNLWL